MHLLTPWFAHNPVGAALRLPSSVRGLSKLLIEPDIAIPPEADRRADEVALVAPGTAADDTVAWIASPEPR